jgi:alanine dehydrogenase
MGTGGTLLLKRGEVASLLQTGECIDAVEEVFGLYALGKVNAPKVIGIHSGNGGFHIKAGTLQLAGNYFAVKTNSNFPDNRKQYNLPTIQGAVMLFDADNGRLLAMMDSMEVTIIRTGAATGVAAKYLAKADARTVTICGCGNQGIISLKAIMKVRKPEKVYAFDIDKNQAEKFSNNFSEEISIVPVTANELETALKQSEIVVTCTTSKKAFIRREHIMPGTFIAAVGADSEEKQELYPELLAANKTVTDITAQCATIGELHHAIGNGHMTADAVYAELGEIVCGKKPGRTSAQEIIVFDSTGTALQDVAAAAIVYEKAVANQIGTTLNFSA